MENSTFVEKLIGSIQSPVDSEPAQRSFTGLTELPETPRLKLDDGKIYSATRKRILPFIARGQDQPGT